MRKGYIILFIIITVSALSIGCNKKTLGESQVKAESTANEKASKTISAQEKSIITHQMRPESEEFIGDLPAVAIDFTLKDMSGNDVRLSDYSGKNILLVFWATWCTYCKRQMPFIEELHKENRDDLVIINVSKSEKESVVKDFLTNRKSNLKVLLDTDGSVTKKYGVITIPGNYLINKEGKVIAKRNSVKDKAQLDEFLKKLEQ